MDVGDDRHRHLGNDRLQRLGGVLVRARDADDIGTRHFELTNLPDGALDVGGQGVGHRLDADGCVSADGNLADMDLAALATFDLAVRP